MVQPSFVLGILGEKMERFFWRHCYVTQLPVQLRNRCSLCLLLLLIKMATAAVAEASLGKDAIAEGLLDLLKPAIQQLDLHVHSVR